MPENKHLSETYTLEDILKTYKQHEDPELPETIILRFLSDLTGKSPDLLLDLMELL